jgi:hypothetical protein
VSGKSLYFLDSFPVSLSNFTASSFASVEVLKSILSLFIGLTNVSCCTKKSSNIFNCGFSLPCDALALLICFSDSDILTFILSFS